NYFTRLLGSHYNGESLHPQYTTPPPQVQGSSQFQERQAMQQQYPPQSMPTPPADTRPDDMVESDGMSNDESRKKWTIEDDKLLASSYLIISTDSVKGNRQNRKDFWERITKYFNDHDMSGNDRTQQSLKSHWFNIIPSVNEFNQCFIQTKRQNHSGWSDDQVMGAARE
ncbi:Glutathione S-transferase T3, partial [Linum perenne]